MSTGSSRSNSNGTGSRGKSRAASAGRSGKNSSRAGQNVRMSAAQKARRNPKRKRKPTRDYRMIAIAGVILILVITGAVFLTKYMKGKPGTETSASETETETQLQKEVTVDGITITGMSKSQAREKLLAHYVWGMKVTYEGGETYEVPNLMESKVDALLDEIYQGKSKEAYTLDTGGLEEAVESEVKAMAAKWDVPAKNGAIAGFNKENGSFIYSGEQKGILIDQEQLKKDMNQALGAKKFDSVLAAKGVAVDPEITEAQAKEMYKVIGTMTTTTTSNKDRNTNIQIAANALDGMIIQPGEEFSFNTTTGNRTTARGYKAAGAYVNGVLVEEPGGGVCQVSSTLYNAVVFSGLSTTERHAHSYEPSYVTPGEDAMVSYDGYAGPDMKFVNNTKDAVAIRARFEKRKLTISIVGIQILPDGEKLYMKSEKTGDVAPPPPTYEENQTLELGVEKVVKQPTNGSRWVTNLVREKDGVVVSDEMFHKSSYRGKAAIVQRNTSGVVVPAATTAAPTESSGDILPVETSSPEPGTAPTGGNHDGPGGPGETTQAAETTPTVPPTPESSAVPDPGSAPMAPGGSEPETIGPNPFG